MRKFEILDIELSPGGPGPEKLYIISYKAIQKKIWVTGKLNIIARNIEDARKKANLRFGEKNLTA
jgi:hypothetical protein